MKKEKWMLVKEQENNNLHWDEVSYSCKEEDTIDVFLLKKNKHMSGKVLKENNTTKVIEVMLDDKKCYLIDFQELDNFFEENHIIFANRPGLHREIRRYIYYSLN
jgi:hypothetical protein